MEQVEAAERQLILSQFEDAEQSSASLLSKRRLTSQEVVSRAAAVYLQAVFEQDRYDKAHDSLITFYGESSNIPFDIFSLWAILAMDSGKAVTVAPALETYIAANFENGTPREGSGGDYLAACRLLAVEVYARELKSTSQALQWLKDSAAQLTSEERGELEGCIQGLCASSSQTNDETAARDKIAHSPTISQPSPSSAARIQCSGNAASLTGNPNLPLKGDSMQNVGMLPSGPQQPRLSNQLPSAEQPSFAQLLHSSLIGVSQYMASCWHPDRQEMDASLTPKRIGWVAATVLVAYATFAERKNISRLAIAAAGSLHHGVADVGTLALSLSPNPMAASQGRFR